MVIRNDPYGAFNFLVSLGASGTDDQVAGGFAEVSGLETEIEYAEYRNGNDRVNNVRKIPGLSRTGVVTLKRGIIGDLSLFDWLKATRDGVIDRRTVTITLLDEQRAPVCRWVLTNAQPSKWVGPLLSAGASNRVAMEELHLVAERLDFQSA
jgi:phage tail-like protein